MLPYNENDGFVGFWISNHEYYVTGDTYENDKRIYIQDNEILEKMNNKSKKSCDKQVLNYFQNKEKNKLYTHFDIYSEGRKYYEIYISGQKSNQNVVIFPNFSSSYKLCKQLSSFNNLTINLSDLICSQFTNSNDNWVDLFQKFNSKNKREDKPLCTSIGHKMASSLIKIAALRIFADAEQSILELPVNSMDSYIPDEQIGKFGMGFFSFLYWLIDHSKRVFYIYSWFENKKSEFCSYCATIKYNEKEGLTLNLRIFESAVTKTGTFMYLDTKLDKFTDENIVKFTSQINKLNRTNSVRLYYYHSNYDSTIRSDTQTFPNNSTLNKADASNPFSIFVAISPTRFFIEDYAKGIPIKILLGSLFVVSISTKTIGSSIKKIPEGWKPKNERDEGFIILVSRVAVVKLIPRVLGSNIYIPKNGGVVLDMPSITQLPVSRDDIILNSTTYKIFVENLLDVLEMGKKDRDITGIQNACQLYYDYTSNDMNRQAINEALSIFTQKNIGFLVNQHIFNGIKNIDTKCIVSNTMNVADVENRLIKEFENLNKINDKVWYGKRIITINYPTSSAINMYGMSSLIFVSEQFQTQINWQITGPQAHPYLNLSPMDTTFGEEKIRKYGKMFSEKIEKAGYADLYITILSIYDGLNVYFSYDNKSHLLDFQKNYKDIANNFSIEEWKNISYALLSKLTSFKGNQTYGGTPYIWVLLDTSFEHTVITQHGHTVRIPENSDKYDFYRELSVIKTIEKNRETNITHFFMRNDLFPDSIYSYLSEEEILKTLHNNILEHSISLVDYTICSIVFIRMLAHVIIKHVYASIFLENLKNAPLISFSRSLLAKIQNLRYSDNDLLDLYSWIGQKSIIHSHFPAYIYKLVDEVLEWWNMVTKIQKPFNYVIDIPSNSKKTITTTSQLIKYLFVNNYTEVNSDNLFEIFNGSSHFNDKEKLKLQIIEIAINEGTTKDFVSACLTELAQNSVDAIRLSNAENRNVNIFYSNTENNTFTIMVEDFVGMPPKAFLYIGIPFLSTKTASDLATGEMGSGFFNVYRESSLVIIDTQFQGINYISYDMPIEDEKTKRIIDVKREINIFPVKKNNSRKDGTKIIIRSKELSEVKRAEYLGLARYTSEKILAQISAFDDIKIVNNGNFNKINKKLMFTIGYFDVYFLDNTQLYPSYIFTKNIPFSPLSNYYTNYASDVQVEVGNNILINIRHGGYTPVQSRTRINMPEEAKNQFQIMLDYIVFVKSLVLINEDTKGRWEWMYQNFSSRTPANQLKRTEQKFTGGDKKDYNISAFFNYINFDLLSTLVYSFVNNIVDYTNKAIDIIGDKQFKDMVKLFDKKLSKFNFSQFPEVEKLGKQIIGRWISTKNPPSSIVITTSPKSQKSKISKKSEKEELRDIIPDEDDKQMDPYVRIWIETFKDKAIKSGIIGWTKDALKNIFIIKSDEQENVLGWYQNNSITINTITWNSEDRAKLIKSITNIKNSFDFQNIDLSIWNKTFSFRYPSTTLPHELEHGRRGSSHNLGIAHDLIRTKLWEDDIPVERTFDQCANAVFSKVLGEGFYEELLIRYTKAKLIK